jgi:hypothetical protein
MATTQETFDFVIQAIDKATAPMRAIANAVLGIGGAAEHASHGVAHVGTAATKVGHEMHGAGEAAHKAAHQVGEVTAHNRGFLALIGHVHLLRHHFGELNVGLGEVGHSMTEFLPMLGALGAAGSLVGLFEVTERMTEMRSQLAKTATEIGTTVPQLEALNMAAKLTDVNVDAMSKGMVRLERSVATAAAGKNKDVAGLFAHLGISLKDSSGHLRSVTDLLPKLADAFRRTTDPALRIRAAMALMGRSGADMIPMLIGGSEELQHFADIAAQVNYAPSAEESEGMERYHRSWIVLQEAVTGFTMALGAKLAPVLQPVIDMTTQWITANRDWIATGIAAKVGELAGWLRTLDLQAIIEQTRGWAQTVIDLSGHVGGLTTVIGAAVLVMGSPLLSGIGSVIGIVGTLGRTFIWLGSLMWANPILAAVGLVAVAAYEVYEHWDWVKGELAAIWTGLVKIFDTGMRDIKGLVNDPVVQTVITAWQALPDFFRRMWDDILGIFRSGLAYIQPIIDKIAGAADAFSHSFIGRHVLGIGSDGGAPAGSPEATGENVLPPPLPSPYGNMNAPAAPTPSAGAAPQDGKVHVQIDVNNLPPGSQVRANSSGAAQTPDLNVGYIAPAFAF